MKIRFLIPLFLAFAFIVSCTSEEEATDVPQNITNQEVEQPVNNGRMPIICPTCDPTYTFLELFSPGTFYTKITVEFDSSMTLDEIHCLKYKYFNCWYKSRLFEAAIQPYPTDPYTEDWFISIGKPLGDLQNDICDDPLTNSPSCDD